MNYTELLEHLGNSDLDPEVLQRLGRLGGDSRDQLTGLYDLRAFSFHLNERLKNLSRGCLMSFSIDHLRELNLLSSWMVGDVALCSLGSCLNQFAESGALVGRTSGSTFTVLLDSTEKQVIQDMVQTVAAFVNQLKLPGTEMFPDGALTMSAGIYLFTAPPDRDASLVAVRRRLEYARSKGGGQAAFVCSDEVSECTIEAGNIQMLVKAGDSEEDGQFYSVKLESLSVTGASFTSEHPFLVRDKLTFEFRSKEKTPLQLGGTVVWRRQKPGEDSLFNTGVKFNELTSDAKMGIEHLMTGGE